MELRGQNIVVLSLFRSDAGIESTAYTVASKLAEHNKVFYIENPYTLKETWNNKKSRSTKWPYDQPGNSGSNFKRIIPPTIFSIHFLKEGRFYRLLLKCNEAIIRRSIQKLLRQQGITDFIFINAFNFHYPNVAHHLDPVLNVYYCLDPVTGAYNGRHGIVSEQILVQNTDVVICSSKRLYREKNQHNPYTYFVPNAADINHSITALSPELPVSALLANIPKPIVGYFGSIEHRFDFELVRKVAEENPGLHFVLAGPVLSDNASRLEHVKNIHFIGRVPYAEMPSIVKGFDVAIIPFVMDEFSSTVFPLKLFEYLGAAKPVVMTHFNEDLKEYTGSLASYCGDAASFSAAVRQAIKTDNDDLKQQRIELAAKHTWEDRLNTISEIIGKALERKKLQKPRR